MKRAAGLIFISISCATIALVIAFLIEMPE